MANVPMFLSFTADASVVGYTQEEIQAARMEGYYKGFCDGAIDGYVENYTPSVGPTEYNVLFVQSPDTSPKSIGDPQIYNTNLSRRYNYKTSYPSLEPNIIQKAILLHANEIVNYSSGTSGNECKGIDYFSTCRATVYPSAHTYYGTINVDEYVGSIFCYRSNGSGGYSMKYYPSAFIGIVLPDNNPYITGRLIDLGFTTQNVSSATYNIASIYPNYASLTKSNFYVQPPENDPKAAIVDYFGDTAYTSASVKAHFGAVSYNASTGDLVLDHYIGGQLGSDGPSAYAYPSCKVYVYIPN